MKSMTPYSKGGDMLVSQDRLKCYFKHLTWLFLSSSASSWLKPTCRPSTIESQSPRVVFGWQLLWHLCVSDNRAQLTALNLQGCSHPGAVSFENFATLWLAEIEQKTSPEKPVWYPIMKVPSTYHTYPGHLAAYLWEAKFSIARCPASYYGITWLNVGGLQGLATMKSFWMSRNEFKTKWVIQLRCFRQNPRLHDMAFISALVLTTQRAPFALRRLLNYTMTIHTAWNVGAQSRLLCATNCSVPTVHTGLICSTKHRTV